MWHGTVIERICCSIASSSDSPAVETSPAAIASPRRLQPPIEGNVDRTKIVEMLTSPIGSDVPTLQTSTYKLADVDSAKQLAQYEKTHVTDPATQQQVSSAPVASQWPGGAPSTGGPVTASFHTGA